MTFIFHVTEPGTHGRNTPIESLDALVRAAERIAGDWLVLRSERDFGGSAAPVDFDANDLAGEVVSLTRDDPRGWFWNHASPRTAAALGCPSGPLLIRRTACDRLDPAHLAGVELELSLPAALAEQGGSFSAPRAQPVAECRFAERSPVPHAKTPRGGSAWTQWLRTLDSAMLLPHVASRIEATAVLAGVWLLNDRLDESHSLSQSIEGAGQGHGDYWHAIMHRREPDFGNAKYWFRQVGRHPAMTDLARVATRLREEFTSRDVAEWTDRLTSGNWDAFATVDLAQHVTQSPSVSNELRAFAEQLQWAEMLLLLETSCRDAAAKPQRPNDASAVGR